MHKLPGIYIHIPFCKQTCYYCNFHFSTSLKYKESFLKALFKEIKLRKDYLNNEPVKTVYFGGGTPSIISGQEIQYIFDELSKYHSIDPNAEITLEANPDDLISAEKQLLKSLQNTPVNRLSIGVQSFFDEDLRFMNRAHSAGEALNSVKASQDAGFGNINIDLLFAIQTMTNEKWERNLDIACSLDIQHMSAYCLMIEPKTVFSAFIKKGKIEDIDEQKEVTHFELLMKKMRSNKFIHYEICNFCKQGFASKHNIIYWSNEKYLGLGPSAHSFNGETRQWNVSNNNKYIRSVETGDPFYEMEHLSENTRYNEYILTSLRMSQGADLNYIKSRFGQDVLTYTINEAKNYINSGMIKNLKNKLVLSDKGKLFADKIAAELFLV
ncbi:MAG: radical SAM family heme chaperone HemW [Bacteroidota bacterium]